MSLQFPTYNRLKVKVASASGVTVTDVNGKEYLDMGAGIGVCNVGHCNPLVQRRVEEQLNNYWHVSNLYELPIQEEVAAKLVENSVFDSVFFCNSGTEANEAAIKLARKHTGKPKIISFEKSFHGRTFGSMAATGQDKIHKGFGKMLETFEYVPFNDFEATKNAIDENTAAVLLELIQGEGGVNIADADFVKNLAAYCHEQGVLLMVDEIQTGIGRTGETFAYEHFAIEPDVMTLAKGLSNGLPVGAMVAKGALKESFGPGSHGTTFGGNPLSMSAASTVLDIVTDADFKKEVTEKSDYLFKKLQDEILPLEGVEAIRGKGMMIGIACDQDVGDYLGELVEDGLLILKAGPNVLRLLPPLTITKEELDQAISKIKSVLIA